MKEFLSLPLLWLSLTFSTSVRGQYISHATLKDKIKNDTLIDKSTGNKFFIDKKRIYITAIAKDGKQLWKTDPAIDNKIEKYRTDRPTIVYFGLGIDDSQEKNAVLHMVYSNTQFGYLN